MSKIMQLAGRWRTANYEEREEARAALLAAVQELGRDAARYRWLREACGATPSHPPAATLQSGAGWQVRYEWYGDRFKPFTTYRMDALDQAVDAAIAACEVGQCETPHVH
jgi:hypothetical protein